MWQTSLVNSSFAAFAELCGGKSIRVETFDSLEAAIKEAASYDGPAVVELMTDAQLV
ncbi:MAG: pyruvate oxidase [Cellvibrionaceae bacterium]